MEQIVNWKSLKKFIVLFVSLILLSGLLFLANTINSVVYFSDPNLEQVIRDKVDKPSAPIKQTELMIITELDASYADITSLDGIQALHKLVDLNLEGNQIEDLSPLSNLKMLTGLNLRYNRVSDLEPLRRLSGLRELDLRANQVSNLGPLSPLRDLEALNVRDNYIKDLSPIAGLTELRYLNIHSNTKIENLDDISGLVNLETLIMRNVPTGDNINFLKNMTNLQRLNMRNSSTHDFSVLGQLMASGVLQDGGIQNIQASVDLLENPLPVDESDPYVSLRLYWDMISTRFPINLPYIKSPIPPPIFSHEGGFYEEGFELVLSTDLPGGVIYYTLDGSEPTFPVLNTPYSATRKYTNPISVTNRSPEANILADIVTTTTNFFVPPDELFKGTVVRAVVVDHNGNKSDVITHSYFVDEDMKTSYTLPVISLSTDAEGLFDTSFGIYTTGVYFQNVYPEETYRNPDNYTQRGMKWERPVYFEMYSPYGDLLFAQNLGIRIHGNATRSYPQKSLRLYARKEYDGKEFIQFNFFDEESNSLSTDTLTHNKTLILRNSGNDWGYAFIRDVLAQSLLKDTGLATQAFEPAILFLNGEYWGIHYIYERYDENYFQYHYGIEPDKMVLLDKPWSTVKIGHPDDIDQYYEMLWRIDPNFYEDDYPTVDNLADVEKFEQIRSRMDIENFLDYSTAQIYFNNLDWPQNNMLMWKYKTNHEVNFSESDFHDGCWRWIVNDVDRGFDDPANNALERVLLYKEFGTSSELTPRLSSTFLIRSLMENKAFEEQFINQFADHLNTIFREDVVVEEINELESILAPEMDEQIQRWSNAGGSTETWMEYIGEVRNFALQRPDYQRQHIAEYFDLPGTAIVNVQTNPDQGYISINSIDLLEGVIGVEDPGDWTGVYFQGVPVQLSATPHKGFQFERWELLGDKIADPNLSTITLDLTGDVQITAVFSQVEP